MELQSILASALFETSKILLAAFGFWIIYAVSNYYHFAHSFTITIGAYAALICSQHLRLPLLFAAVIGLLSSALFGWVYERALFSPLKSAGTSNLVLLLASVAVDIAGKNYFSLAFGDLRLSFREPFFDSVVQIGNISLSVSQVLIVLSALLVALGLNWLHASTSVGLLFRAVSDDRRLAQAQGVSVNQITSVSFITASILAGLTGLLLGLDVDVTPGLGQEPLIVAATAVVLAGRGSVLRLVTACAALALIQVLAVWVIGAAWKEEIALLLLLLVLVIRPGELLRSLSDRRQLLKTVSD